MNDHVEVLREGQVPRDFTPCDCGHTDADSILIHRCDAPVQMRGDLYVVCCRWCGRSAPFVYLGWSGDSVGPEAIKAWNDRTALDHAIATCERHAALVARLGEAHTLLSEVSRSGWGRNTMFDIAKKTPLLERIDSYLARVVKENEG